VQLLGPGTSVLDAVGYGEFAPGEFFAGEGTPTVDPAAGSSIARLFANVDTDRNAFDFAASAPTPGTGPLASVPEPSTAGLLALGLAVLVRGGRRRPARA
jgi:hypothetical protein